MPAELTTALWVPLVLIAVLVAVALWLHMRGERQDTSSGGSALEPGAETNWEANPGTSAYKPPPAFGAEPANLENGSYEPRVRNVNDPHGGA